MSINFHVFAHAERLPTAAHWAKAIGDFGFSTRLGTHFDLLSFSGYLPCPDDRTGFELYVEPFSGANFEIGSAGLKAVADRDTMLTFRFSGRESDLAAASAAAASLAAMTDGVLFDTESRHFIDAASALAWARQEAYRPIGVYKARASRRRARIPIPTILRLLIILALAAAVIFTMVDG